MKIYRKAWAEISKKALTNNYNITKELASGEVIAIVKAGAYGHGVGCASVLYDAGCRYFAVATAPEARELRRELDKKGKDAEILLLGYTDPRNVKFCLENNITLSVFSEEYAQRLQKRLKDKERLKIHIKLNTGMNRLGFSECELDGAVRVLLSDCFECTGVFSHFACADAETQDKTDRQIAVFDRAVEYLESRGAVLPLKHILNSAAIYCQKNKYGAVRAGVSLYGFPPTEYADCSGLMPVMSFKTRVAQVRELSEGDGVSYGHEYIADGKRKVAVIPVGYADGYVRAYKGAYVTIAGKKAPLLGRICMDMCMADVTDIPNVKCGDEVVLFGNGGMSVPELARHADTIAYEVTTILSRRVKRVFTD